MKCQLASFASFAFLTVAVIAASSAVARAQGATTGTIRGIVVDTERAPVPFATVTIRSASLQGQRSTATSTDGSYVFGHLPPGEYDVAFEATRLAPTTRRTRLFHSSSLELNVTMQDAGPDKGRAPAATAALTASPTIATHFTHDEIARLPIGRTLSGFPQLAPGVSANTPDRGQLAIHGAFAYDSVFTVNGVDISDNVFGSPQDVYVEDAIAETAVLSSGLPAEYGRLTGGVVSAITRSGGNRFSGNYRANLSNPSWTQATPLERCDPAVTLASCTKAAPRLDLLRASHEATLGGFVVRDRLWFFAAGRAAEESNSTVLARTNVLNTATTSNQRGEIKLTAAVAHGQTLTFDTAANRTTDTRLPYFNSTVDPAAIGGRRVPNYYDGANYRAVVGKRAFVEGQIALRRWERYDTASTSTTIADSPMFARTTLANGSPAQYNAPYFDIADPETRNIFQGGGSVSYNADAGRRGRHEIKGGYEFFRSQHIGGASPTATGYVFDTDYLTNPDGTTPTLDANGRFIPLWVPGKTLIENWLPTRGAMLTIDTQSVYLQDRWAIGSRLSADVGLRHEQVRSTITNSFAGVDSRTLQPRAALGYRLAETHNQIVRATYGQYVGRFEDAAIARDTGLANPNRWLGVYFGGIGQGRGFAPGLDPANYLTLAGRFPTANVSVDDAIQSPLVREFTTSYAIESPGGKGFVEAAYVWRDWKHFIDDFVSIANGTTLVARNGFDVGTFTNVAYRNADEATRRYEALELSGRYLVLPRWTVNGSYTAQLRNEGNVTGEEPGLPGAASALGNYPEVFTAARQFPTGRLPSFQRSTLRLWSTYGADFRRFGAAWLSGVVRANSGRVYSLAAANQPLTTTQTAILKTAGYPDKPVSQTVFFGPRGSQTFGGYAVVDLAVVYEVPIVKALRPWAKLEIYNALNNQSLVAWDTTIVPDPASATDALGLPTGYLPAPTFGKATSADQFPTPFQGDTGGRTFRVAVGIRF